MTPRRLTRRAAAGRVADRSISATSMIVTVFGDAVSQHGGWIWLGSLIEALAPFGFGERSLRTAANRLAQQDWLKSQRQGRRSFFAFTGEAQGHYERAARRIYSPGRQEWDGCWTLVLLPGLPEKKRNALVKSLSWQGFSSLAGGLYARPSAERVELDETISGLDLAGQVTVLRASTEEAQSQSAIQDLARRKWSLDQLNAQYKEFLSFYRPLANGLKPGDLTPGESFRLRTLMVHDYRRILLRDPGFPDAILPAHWSGLAACDLIRRTYKTLANSSANYIRQNLQNAQGPMPPPNRSFHHRFTQPS